MAEDEGQSTTAEVLATPNANIQYGGEDRFVLELEVSMEIFIMGCLTPLRLQCRCCRGSIFVSSFIAADREGSYVNLSRLYSSAARRTLAC